MTSTKLERNFLWKYSRENFLSYNYIWCDNISAKENTEKEWSHKLKDFDDQIETIQENFSYRAEAGKRKHLVESHGDYIKYLVIKCEKIKVKYVNTL